MSWFKTKSLTIGTKINSDVGDLRKKHPKIINNPVQACNISVIIRHPSDNMQ